MYLPVIADGDGPAMDDVRALKTRLLQFPLSQLRLHPDTASPAYLKLTRTSITRMPKHHYLTPVLKSLHRLKIPECIHFKVMSLTSWAETWRRIWGGPNKFFAAQFQGKFPFSGLIFPFSG